MRLASAPTNRLPLSVDPFYLTGSKNMSRKSLTLNTHSQLTYEGNVQAYKREFKKTIHNLKNSRQHMMHSLQKIQDRQLQIAKDREKEAILIQAQHLYDKSPILDTKRVCGACSTRPKSAKANTEVTISGLRRPITANCKIHRMTFSAYEKRTTPPKPKLIRDAKTALPRVTSDRKVCFSDQMVALSSPPSPTPSLADSQYSDSSEISKVRVFNTIRLPNSINAKKFVP